MLTATTTSPKWGKSRGARNREKFKNSLNDARVTLHLPPQFSKVEYVLKLERKKAFSLIEGKRKKSKESGIAPWREIEIVNDHMPLERNWLKRWEDK